MIYRILADIMVVAHLAFIAFVFVGGLFELVFVEQSVTFGEVTLRSRCVGTQCTLLAGRKPVRQNTPRGCGGC